MTSLQKVRGVLEAAKMLKSELLFFYIASCMNNKETDEIIEILKTISRNASQYKKALVDKDFNIT